MHIVVRMENNSLRFIMMSFIILIVLYFACIIPVYSQVSDHNAGSQSLSDETDFREKVFLHTDRKLYLSGEILWFKAYCIEHDFNIPSDVSKVLYVEILNNQNQSILREKTLLEKGKSHGTIYIPRSIQTGIYYIRAYTKWMTNYPPEFYFTERILIVNPFLPLETIHMVPEQDAEYIIRFYTAGQVLETGQVSNIVFHAANRAGKGLSLKGWVVSEAGDTLASLKTWKYGFGLFSFIPGESEDSYRIITISSNGYRKVNLLPFPVLDESNTSQKSTSLIAREKFKIDIITSKVHYSTRENVTLIINTKNSNGEAMSADLSVSVYKDYAADGLYQKNIVQYLNSSSFLRVPLFFADDQFPYSAYDSDTLKSILDILYSYYSIIDTSNYDNENITNRIYTLPETRGLTLNGTLFKTEDGKPSPGVKLYVAQPGKNARIYLTRSVYNGRFQIQFYNQFGRNDIIVMPAENPEKYYILLDEDFSNVFASIDTESFFPDESTISYIEKLMVNMQIDDAFGIKLADSKDSREYDLPPIYGVPDETILLEDYIRLPAVEELFTELVKSVLIKRRRNNNFELQIIDPSSRLPITGKPLLLLDGVPVLDINPVIIYMDPVDIEKIEVVSSRYIQGGESYQGIINLITKQGDFHHFDLPSYGIREPYLFFQIPLEFYSPDHSSDSDSLRSLPDFRNLLYWNPQIKTDEKGTATVSFYTCDDISNYRIVVQGLDEYGLPGYAEGTISVK
jgi:hypothetical protein